METKANYILVGAATVAGAVLIMMFAMWLASSEFRRGFNIYEIEFDDPVRGLTEGGEVRFNGIKVGEVESLRIDADNSNRVIARVRISTDVPVREDSIAQLEPIGLTGVTLIQLTPGSTGAPLLRPTFGGPPPRIEGKGSQIDQIMARSQEIVMQANEAMAAVRRLLTDENIAEVSRIIANLETISGQLADRNSVISRSAETAQEVTGLARDLRRELADLDRTVAGINEAARVAGEETLPELSLAAEEIRRASAAITRVANNIDENPSILTPRSPRPTVELP